MLFFWDGSKKRALFYLVLLLFLLLSVGCGPDLVPSHENVDLEIADTAKPKAEAELKSEQKEAEQKETEQTEAEQTEAEHIKGAVSAPDLMGEEKDLINIDKGELEITKTVPPEPEGTNEGEKERGVPDLLITGSGLEKDVFLYESDWLNFDSPEMVIRYYSSNNNFDFHKIWKVKGFDLLALLEEGKLKPEKDWDITFVARDGLEFAMRMSTLQDLYYYCDLTLESAEAVGPLLGFYRTELYDSNKPDPPASWDDPELTKTDLDEHAPRLYMGQKQGDISDRNQPFFVRELVRILVGEER